MNLRKGSERCEQNHLESCEGQSWLKPKGSGSKARSSRKHALQVGIWKEQAER